jgi:hypothetical protein
MLPIGTELAIVRDITINGSTGKVIEYKKRNAPL